MSLAAVEVGVVSLTGDGGDGCLCAWTGEDLNDGRRLRFGDAEGVVGGVAPDRLCCDRMSALRTLSEFVRGRVPFFKLRDLELDLDLDLEFVDAFAFGDNISPSCNDKLSTELDNSSLDEPEFSRTRRPGDGSSCGVLLGDKGGLPNTLPTPVLVPVPVPVPVPVLALPSVALLLVRARDNSVSADTATAPRTAAMRAAEEVPACEPVVDEALEWARPRENEREEWLEARLSEALWSESTS